MPRRQRAHPDEGLPTARSAAVPGQCHQDLLAQIQTNTSPASQNSNQPPKTNPCPKPHDTLSLTNPLLRDSVLECASPLALWLSAIPSLASLSSGEPGDNSPSPQRSRGKGKTLKRPHESRKSPSSPFPNPNGIPPSSPGLSRQRDYPGKGDPFYPNPICRAVFLGHLPPGPLPPLPGFDCVVEYLHELQNP